MTTRIVLVILLAAPSGALWAAEPTRTWEGVWENKRYGTNGTLKCVAVPNEDGKWTATFSGMFMTERFSFDVEFDAKKSKNQYALAGKAEIRNHKYQWTGVIKGDMLAGNFRSNSGYFGGFVLKERKSP